jgi:hypothetical protein
LPLISELARASYVKVREPMPIAPIIGRSTTSRNGVAGTAGDMAISAANARNVTMSTLISSSSSSYRLWARIGTPRGPSA